MRKYLSKFADQQHHNEQAAVQKILNSIDNLMKILAIGAERELDESQEKQIENNMHNLSQRIWEMRSFLEEGDFEEINEIKNTIEYYIEEGYKDSIGFEHASEKLNELKEYLPQTINSKIHNKLYFNQMEYDDNSNSILVRLSNEFRTKLFDKNYFEAKEIMGDFLGEVQYMTAEDMTMQDKNKLDHFVKQLHYDFSQFVNDDVRDISNIDKDLVNIFNFINEVLVLDPGGENWEKVNDVGETNPLLDRKTFTPSSKHAAHGKYFGLLKRAMEEDHVLYAVWIDRDNGIYSIVEDTLDPDVIDFNLIPEGAVSAPIGFTLEEAIEKGRRLEERGYEWLAESKKKIMNKENRENREFQSHSYNPYDMAEDYARRNTKTDSSFSWDDPDSFSSY